MLLLLLLLFAAHLWADSGARHGAVSHAPLLLGVGTRGEAEHHSPAREIWGAEGGLGVVEDKVEKVLKGNACARDAPALGALLLLLLHIELAGPAARLHIEVKAALALLGRVLDDKRARRCTGQVVLHLLGCR